MRVRALIATGIIATTLFIPAHTAIALDGPRADKSNGVVVSNQQPSNNPKSDSGGTPKEFGEPSSSSESNMGPSTSLDSSIEEGAGSPFGSGSSREHAAWAIAGYGFRAVVSSFFADIHKNNELNNFVLPVVVSPAFLQELFDSIQADPKMQVEINLPAQTITNKATGKSEHFDINAYKKHCLMNGLDDIDFLLENVDKIVAYEQNAYDPS